MKKHTAKNRRGPAALMKAVVRMPPPDFYRRPVLHIDCGGRIEVEGCRSILLCNEDMIRLDLGRWQVSLCGDALRIEALTRRELQICGQVLRVEFSMK